MANGGFKAFQAEVTGLASSATLAERKTAASTLLQEIGTKLVALGEGWSYDSECSSTGVPCAYPEGAFSDMGDTPQTLYLGFVHTNGTKMLIAYNVYNFGFDATAFLKTYRYAYSSGNTYFTGALCISMIPPSCGSYNYGVSNPIPSQGLKLHGPCITYNSQYSKSVLYTYTEGYKFRYTIIVRGNQIITIGQSGDSTTYSKTRLNVNIYGDIINCAQSEDTFANKGFGTLDTKGGSLFEEYQCTLDDSYDAFKNGSTNAATSAQFYNAQGVVVDATSGNGRVNNNDTCIVSGCTISNTARYVCVPVYTDSNAISSTGDTFKGFLNPEVGCIVKKSALPIGTLLDNGNYIMLLGGLVVGWDPSNTVSFN